MFFVFCFFVFFLRFLLLSSKSFSILNFCFLLVYHHLFSLPTSTSEQNSVLVPGYAVDGTLAKTILSKPESITAQNGRQLPRRCDVEYISFSAHADYVQTKSFIRQLNPGHVVLVHGAEKEMKRMAVRLKTLLMNEREEDKVRVDTPRNTQKIYFEFLQTKVAKVIGAMAEECESAELAAAGGGSGSGGGGGGSVIHIKGILVNQNFSHKILSTNDIKTYTDLTVNKISQKMHVPYWNTFELVEYFLGQVFDSVVRIENSSGGGGGGRGGGGGGGGSRGRGGGGGEQMGGGEGG